MANEVNKLQFTSSSTMETTVISREMIKPSTPTPHHLKHLNLSLIDQYMPLTNYVHILLVYSAQGDVGRFKNANMSDRLKKSLSEVLTQFYPLAGTANSNNQWIDCDDSGLEYIEARVKAPHTLDQLLSRPNVEELDHLVPQDAYAYTTGFKGLSAVQVTVFEECGGMAVGVSLSHILTDASSLGVFVDSWALIARGADTTAPKFDFSSLFPPRDVPAPLFPPGGDHQDTHRDTKIVVKRFVFPQSKIDALKAKLNYQSPTKVEVLSALIFKSWIKVSKSRSPKPTSLSIAMNLRGRMSPPLSMHHFGNMVLLLMIKHASLEASLNDLGVQLRELIKGADADVKRLQADNLRLLFERFDEEWKSFSEDRLFSLTSWCRFPFYEADLGWGGPTWVAPVYTNDQDSCLLIDAKNGDGIDAWLILEEEDMKLFESDSELIQFTGV